MGCQESAEPSPGEPRGLYRFLATLRAEAPHGERFLYRSAESDVLGWVCERAAGQPMPALISELIWAPMGAEHDAVLLHDSLGTAVHDGGLCATARDVARFGQMLLDGGQVPDGTGGTRGVVPPQWLRRAWAVDSDARGVFAASPVEWAFPGGWYRHQFWFRPGDHGDVLLGLGIHGQMLHVSRRTEHGPRELLLPGRTRRTRPTWRTRCAPSTRSAGSCRPRSGAAPPGRGGLRPEPQRRHHAACPAAPHRGLSRPARSLLDGGPTRA